MATASELSTNWRGKKQSYMVILLLKQPAPYLSGYNAYEISLTNITLLMVHYKGIPWQLQTHKSTKLQIYVQTHKTSE